MSDKPTKRELRERMEKARAISEQESARLAHFAGSYREVRNAEALAWNQFVDASDDYHAAPDDGSED